MLFRRWRRGGKSTHDDDDDDKRTNSKKNAAGTDDDRPAIPPVAFHRLFRFSTPLELFLDFIGIICAIGAGASQPLMTLIFGRLTVNFVDFADVLDQPTGPLTEEQVANFQQLADSFRASAADNSLYIVLIGVGMWVTTWVYMVIWTWTGEVNSKRIREYYLKAVLRQDIAYYDTLGAGEVATRIQTDTHVVQSGISEKIPIAVTFIAAFFTGFILAFIRSWKLSLAISSILPCIIMAGGLMGFFLSKFKTKQLVHTAQGGTLAEEVIATVRTAHAFGIQQSLGKLYDEHISRQTFYEIKMGVALGWGFAVMFFVIYGAYGLAFHFGTTLMLAGEADAGVIINVLLSIMIGSFSLAMLAPQISSITQAMGAAAKLFDTIDRVPPIDSASDQGLKPATVRGELTFNDVKFTYPSRPDVQVLHGLSLTFEAGKTTALVGASGCGKSTVVGLLERFYDPAAGTIQLDGQDLSALNVRWLRAHIGLVSQEPVLFSSTIRANVEHGLIGTHLENASAEDRARAVKEACVKANADGFIGALPDGYDTLVGERGFLLSGGQKQRIAIARAIVSDPPILLLDEATSALDTRSEGVVQNALDNASRGRTTVTIAHRLSTIKDADRIYVFGEGRILEQGTHSELLADPEGPYSKLVQAQKLKEITHPGDEERDDETGTGSEDETKGERSAADATPAEEKSDKHVPEQIDEKHPPHHRLDRASTNKSITSEVIRSRATAARKGGKVDFASGKQEKMHGNMYLCYRMAKINSDHWRLYLVAFVASCVQGMAQPIFGIIYAQAMTDFTLTGSALRTAGDRNALWFFIVGLIAAIASGIQDWSAVVAAARLVGRLRTMSFRALLRQDVAFFDEDKNSTGALTAGLAENPEKILGMAGITLAAITGSLATIVGGSIIGLVYAWKLAIVAIASLPAILVTGFIQLHVVVLKDQKNKEAHEASSQIACEAAAAIRTVASLTREEDFVRMYSESLEGPLKNSNRSSIWRTFWYALTQATVFFCNGLVFWYGSRLVANQEYTIFQFFIVIMSVTFSSANAANVFAFSPDISKFRSAADKIIRLVDARPDVDAEATDGVVLSDDTIRGHIEFKNVHFRYPTRPGVPVLRGFNLVVEPGTHVALVGASGCGKSTTIQLIERFYDPMAGQVLFDGHPIDDLPVSEYRKHLALVSQEPTLYAGTIKFNVLLGATKPHEEVTQEELEAVCRDANILDFIQGLPQGFDTPVGGKGSQLSGGQKQRIAIARALIRNPSVLLLDEATSALDSNSERVVQDALDRAVRGRTTISIAHRLSTIQKCDKICFVQDGKIVEDGTHDELIRRPGSKYAEYVLLQDLSGTTNLPTAPTAETAT